MRSTRRSSTARFDPSPWLGLTAGLGLVLAVAALFHYLNFSIASYVSLFVIFLVTLSLGAYSLRWGIWLDTAFPALCLLVIKWFVNLKGVWQSWRKPGVAPRALLSTRYQAAAGAAPNDGLARERVPYRTEPA